MAWNKKKEDIESAVMLTLVVIGSPNMNPNMQIPNRKPRTRHFDLEIAGNSSSSPVITVSTMENY